MGALEHGSMGALVLWFFGSLVKSDFIFLFSRSHHHPPPTTPPPYPYTVNTTLSAAWLVVVGVVSRP